MSNLNTCHKMDKQMTWRQGLILNLGLLVIGCFLTYAFTRHGQSIDKNDEVIKSKADITFVIDQDNQIKDKVKDHQTSDDKRWNQLFDELKGIKEQQNILINRAIQKNN